jgi:hypothetical protein
VAGCKGKIEGMDLITVAQVVTASNHASSLVKNLYTAAKQSGRMESLGDILELQGAMMELQLKQQDVIQQLEESQSRVKELEQALKFAGELVRDENSLYLKSDDKREQPYCLACWGYEQKLVGEVFWNDGTSKCRICLARGDKPK